MDQQSEKERRYVASLVMASLIDQFVLPGSKAGTAIRMESFARELVDHTTIGTVPDLRATLKELGSAALTMLSAEVAREKQDRGL